MNAMEDNKTNASPQETPRRESPDSRAAQPSDSSKQKTSAVTPDADEQPTPPRLRRVPPKSDAPPPEAPAAPRRSTTRKLSAPPEGSLADMAWMPPVEDRVAQFLSDVADIPAPPPRAREGSPGSSFVLPAATSPEEARRKKARAEPFWSQIEATPMEPPAPAPPRTRRAWHRRGRLRLWLVLSAASLILVVVALVVVVYTHPGLLHLR